MKFLKIIATFLALIGTVSEAADSEFWGYIVAVKDGDSAYVKPLPDKNVSPSKVNLKPVTLRLANIDAPEYSKKCTNNQPFGLESRNYLARLIDKKVVYVKISTKDRYGRSIASIFNEHDLSVPVNNKLVSEGLAWVYRQYNKDRTLLASESKAKMASKGIWSEHDPIEPSVWRKTESCHH